MLNARGPKIGKYHDLSTPTDKTEHEIKCCVWKWSEKWSGAYKKRQREILIEDRSNNLPPMQMYVFLWSDFIIIRIETSIDDTTTTTTTNNSNNNCNDK